MHKSRHHLPPLHPYLFPFHLRLDVVNSTVVIVIEYITAKALKLICYVMIMPSTRLRKRIRRVECSLSWYRAQRRKGKELTQIDFPRRTASFLSFFMPWVVGLGCHFCFYSSRGRVIILSFLSFLLFIRQCYQITVRDDE